MTGMAEGKIKKHDRRKGLAALTCLFLLLAALPVHAQQSDDELKALANHDLSSGSGKYETALDDTDHVDSLYLTFFKKWIYTVYHMGKQYTVTMMHQAAIAGMFFDAKIQLETQTELQRRAAQTQRDYQPDALMCSLGTNVRDLSASALKADATAQIISKELFDRQTQASAYGDGTVDIPARIEQYLNSHCDPRDGDAQMQGICASGAGGRVNADINYTRLIEENRTLDADFTDTTLTGDEESILSLLHNLFAHYNFAAIGVKHTTQPSAEDDYGNKHSINSIRSVILNSISHLVGMRAKGPNGAGQFMTPLIKQLGMDDDEISAYLGSTPSYYAQMDVLTQKIYQNPAFYTNLYTNPANVQRIGASLQAIGLMQDRDRYESALRREMLISLMLELELRDKQEEVTKNILGGSQNLYVIPLLP